MKLEKKIVMRWYAQAGNLTTNMKVEIYLPNLNLA